MSELISDLGHAPMGNPGNRLENNRTEPGPDVGTAAVQGGDMHRWAKAR